jgi:hypothetical protein
LFYFHACYNILGEATVHVVFDHEDVLKDVDAVFKLHEDTPTFVDNLMWRFAGKAALYALVDGWCYIRINDKYPSVDSIFQEINNNLTKTETISVDKAIKLVNKYGKGKYISYYTLDYICISYIYFVVICFIFVNTVGC